MSKKRKPTNPILRGLIRRLRKKSKETEKEIWSELAERLDKANRSRAEVNISQINRNSEEDDTVVIPGKVLGSGKLDHPLTVVAFGFSARGRRRIEDAGGSVMTIEEFLDEGFEGENVTIME